MAIVIMEGKISELSNGVVSNRYTDYAFVTIGGKRMRRIRIDHHLDSFIRVGAVVRMACTKSFGHHMALAIQESNGEISKSDIGPIVFTTLLHFVGSLIIGAIVALFTYLFSNSVFMTVCAYAAFILGVPYMTTGSFYKARNALNGMAAPGEAAIA
ncbi:hypothetical protein [Marinobacter sp.]|uniref:hypothetical protein n=1 Tax=Marinobacter sp. TaxID=50741 RepID=UPI003A944E70